MEEVGAIKVPKSLKAKVIPVVNFKLEVNVGVISPFSQEYIGVGVDAAAHICTPLQMTITRKLTQLALDIKVPEEVKREVEVAHVSLTPFTVKKDLRLVSPISKSANLKVILSGEPKKVINTNIGAPLDMDAKLIAESDAKYTDLYSFWEKISQHNPITLINSFYLPSTLRMSSVMVAFNPQQSRTKEISLLIGVLNVVKTKTTEQAERYPAVHIEHSVSEVNHVKQVCVDMYPKNPAKFSECVLSLTGLEVATRNVDDVCKVPFPRCQSLADVCHEAKAMCETMDGYVSPRCQKAYDICIKRILNVENVHKAMSQLDNQGSVWAIRLDASMLGSSKALSTAITLGYKMESSTPVKDTVKMVSNVEVKTPVAPVYEIKLASTADIPRVNTRWNREQLLQQALNLILNGQVVYGYVNSPQETITLKSSMIKSGKQIEAVRKSPEFLRCKEQEQLGRPLAPVCEIVRHQAASVDEISTELTIPSYLHKYTIIRKLAGLTRSLLIGQLFETPSTYVSDVIMKINAKVSRDGNEGQVIIEYNGIKYEITNIRLPTLLKGVLPISLRNPLLYLGVQKLSANQIPTSCHVGHNHITTFDKKTYDYELNDCYHMLFGGEYRTTPVLVMGKMIPGAVKELSKEIEIIVHPFMIIRMTPVSATNMKVLLTMDGQEPVVTLQPGEVKRFVDQNSLVLLEITRYEDNVYLVNAVQEGLWVLFDGQHAEISASALMKSKAYGLCGDLNGENTADLKTPQRCLMSQPKLAAYSYMFHVPNTCQGIPSQDIAKYQKEINECTKQEFIPTPLERLSKMLVEPISVKPLIQQHLVQRMPESGKVCISKQMVKICSKVNKSEIKEPKPIKVQRKKLEYVCEEASTHLAQQLEHRAKSGEVMTMEVINKPVAFSKFEYEPVICQRQI